MNCLVCGAKAELIDVTIDGGASIACPRCGEYAVSSADIATGQMERLEPEQRRAVLDEAKRSAQPGARPMITTHLLA
jgi:ribosome-binding protein aMBF1 (putative translation factor)